MSPETIPAENEQETPQVINLLGVSVEHVGAEMVRASQSRLNRIEAGEVEIRESMAVAVSTSTISARESVILAAETDTLHASKSGLGMVMSNQASIEGRAGFVVADSLTINGTAGFLIAPTVQSNRLQTGILIARHVEGDVETLMNTRQVLLAGVMGGMVAGLILLAGRLLFGRKK